jgi:hypothetical protein
MTVNRTGRQHAEDRVAGPQRDTHVRSQVVGVGDPHGRRRAPGDVGLLHQTAPEGAAQHRLGHRHPRQEVVLGPALTGTQIQRPALVLEKVDAADLRTEDAVGPVDDEARHVVDGREGGERLEELVGEEDLGETALELLVRPLERLLARLELAFVASDLVVGDLELDEELLLLLTALLRDEEVPDHLRPAGADQLDIGGLLLHERAPDLFVVRQVDDEIQSRHLIELRDVGSGEDAEILGKPDGGCPVVGVRHCDDRDVLHLVEQAQDRRGAQGCADDGDVELPGAEPGGDAFMCHVGHGQALRTFVMSRQISRRPNT